MTRAKITSRIQSRARFHAMNAIGMDWKHEALAVDYIAESLADERFPADQAQIAAQAAWDNTKSQPPN